MNTATNIVEPEKQKVPHTLYTKGFEALFSWFKLIVSEPDYVYALAMNK